MSSASAPSSRGFWRSPLVVAGLTALAGVLLFELAMARSGGEPGQALLFLGRFHPLIVHLPIGIWVLVALAELATLLPRLRARIDPALDLALPVLLATTVTAFALGHFLGKAGGFPRGALTLHRRLELFATLGTAVCLVLWAYQARRGTDGPRWAYRGVLAASVSLLSIGGHFGGTLTRGETYLAKYAPGFLKPLLGGKEEAKAKAAPSAAKPPSAEPLLYSDVVQPLLEKYCVECHGADEQKGKLRLDSLAGMQKGGENGAVIKAGSSESSSLVTRMLLPKSDDDHMPPEDEPQPSADEIAVLRFWVDRGASDSLRVRDLLVPDGARKLLLNAVGSVKAPEPEAPEPDQPSAAISDTKEPETKKPEPETKEPEATTPAPEPEAPVATLTGPAILAAKCEKCHGASKQKAKLRVDSVAALLKGGKSGPALVPGSPEKSNIIQRIRLPLGDDEHMPPRKEPQLDAAELATLTAWVQKQSASRPPAEVADKPSEPPVAQAAQAPEPEAPTQPAAAPAKTAPETAEASAEHAALLAELPPSVRLWDAAVHPILMGNCGDCHSGAAPKADLDVDSVDELRKGGWSGPGVVPGKPAESLIVQRSKLPESDDDRMPPPPAAPIKQGELDLVEAWIAGGAAADGTTETKTLSAPALAILSETLRAPRARAAEHEKVEASAGGCAACTIGDARPTPWAALFATFAAATALLLRRRG